MFLRQTTTDQPELSTVTNMLPLEFVSTRRLDVEKPFNETFVEKEADVLLR